MQVTSLVYRNCLSSRGVARKVWSLARKTMIKWMGDPVCSLPIHGRDLKLPLSHCLPSYLKKYPFYDRLPGRICDFAHATDGLLNCIDVGANIGDTIASFRKSDRDVFLAIEPNPKFHKLLRANWGSDQNVTIVTDLCSSKSDEDPWEIREQNGTASVVRNDRGTMMRRRTLDDILLTVPASSSANVLKIDTDGHDFDVLQGAEQFLSRNRPAVLFECDAPESETYVEDCLSALRSLERCGYNGFLLYDNYGCLMGRHALADLAAFRDLLFFQLTSSFYYFDILVMRDEHLVSFHKSEVEYFCRHMSNPAQQRTAAFAATLDARSRRAS
jgi:FkbM family methyltransferase